MTAAIVIILAGLASLCFVGLPTLLLDTVAYLRDLARWALDAREVEHGEEPQPRHVGRHRAGLIGPAGPEDEPAPAAEPVAPTGLGGHVEDVEPDAIELDDEPPPAAGHFRAFPVGHDRALVIA